MSLSYVRLKNEVYVVNWKVLVCICEEKRGYHVASLCLKEGISYFADLVTVLLFQHFHQYFFSFSALHLKLEKFVNLNTKIQNLSNSISESIYSQTLIINTFQDKPQILVDKLSFVEKDLNEQFCFRLLKRNNFEMRVEDSHHFLSIF